MELMLTFQKKQTSKGRTYTIPDVGDLYSVTSIIDATTPKPYLLAWAKKATADYWEEQILNWLDDVGDEDLKATLDIETLYKKSKRESSRLSREALDIGSEVHSLIECSLKGDTVPEPTTPESERCFGAYLKWVAEHEVEVYRTEQTVWGMPGYAGTLDFVGKVDGRVMVVDFKTAKDIYDDYPVQLSAYFHAYNQHEKPEDKAEDAGCLRLDKAKADYEFEVYTPKVLNIAYALFLAKLDQFSYEVEFKQALKELRDEQF